MSCSSSKQDNPYMPEPDTPLTEIDFGGKGGGWQDAPTTRAASTGLETLFKSFRVWGYKTTDEALKAPQLVMDGYNVEYTESASPTTSNTSSWEYVGIDNNNLSAKQTIKYWDYSATSYRFFGYSPTDSNIKKVEDKSSDTSSPAISLAYDFTYDEDATATTTPYLSELWYSSDKTESGQYGKAVTMTFAPMIAKVRFKFTYPAGTETIVIKDISFGDSRFTSQTNTADTPLRGTITASYPLTGTLTSTKPLMAWTPAEENPTGSLTFTIPYETASDEIHIINDSTLYNKWYYVPPLSIIPYEQGAYTMTAIIDGNNASATVPAEFMKWRPGFQYTYIFKITEAGTVITFADLQVEQWLPGTEIDNKGTGTEGW